MLNYMLISIFVLLYNITYVVIIYNFYDRKQD